MIQKKNMTLLTMLCCSGYVFSQVGINTESPENTFDIRTKKNTGKSRAAERLLLAKMHRPRAKSLTSIFESAPIDINDIETDSSSGVEAKINKAGYYFYDGNAWTKVKTTNDKDNFYTTDGSLSGNRIVAQEGNKLAFTGTAVDAFSVDGNTFSVDAGNSRVGVGTNAPTADLDVNGTTRLRAINGVTGTHDDRLLVSDDDGNIRTIDFVPRRAFYETTSLAPGEHQTITVLVPNFLVSQISVSSVNACTKTMISTFSRNYDSLSFLGGQARNSTGNWKLLDNEGNNGSVRFPDVIRCADGGAHQFDYDIKVTGTAITITNRGNVNRQYSIRILTNL